MGVALVVDGPPVSGADEVFSLEARGFLEELHRRFNPRRLALLQQRQVVQQRLQAGWQPTFRQDTQKIRDQEWTITAEVPDDLLDRRVEITGPTDRKMVINALNSGARVFMADFEDANSPTWANLIQGQINLTDAIARRIQYPSPDGRLYQLNDQVATLVVRPRGWHLPERHLMVDGEPMAGALVDFG
jgi:malate synthase